MIYLLLFLFVAAILLYVVSRWLSTELKGFCRWARERWILARGGQSPERLIQTTLRAFAAEGLDPDFLVVSRQALPCYERLRREYIDRRHDRPLPAAVVLALAADVDAGRLFLRAVVTPGDAPGRDLAEFLRFDQVESVQAIAATLPPGPAPATEQALEIVTTGPGRPVFHLALEREWGIAPDELARRIQSMIAGHWRPDAPPAIVR